MFQQHHIESHEIFELPRAQVGLWCLETSHQKRVPGPVCQEHGLQHGLAQVCCTQKDVKGSQQHEDGTLFNVFEAKETLFLFQKTFTFILAKRREGCGVWLLKKPGSAKP